MLDTGIEHEVHEGIHTVIPYCYREIIGPGRKTAPPHLYAGITVGTSYPLVSGGKNISAAIRGTRVIKDYTNLVYGSNGRAEIDVERIAGIRQVKAVPHGIPSQHVRAIDGGADS